MKKLLILFLTISLFTACNDNNPRGFNNKNGDGDGGWTNKLRNKYLKECIDEAGDNAKLAKKVCSCVLEKVEKKYTVEEAEELSEAVGAKLARECMEDVGDNGAGEDDYGVREKKDDDENGYDEDAGWTKRQREQYIDDCASAAQQNLSRSQANSYCDCMQSKIEKKYRMSFAEASKITAEDLSTDETKADIRECLGN